MTAIMETALLHKIQKDEIMPLSLPQTITTFGRSQSNASFAQQRVWSDENLYHDPSTSPALNNLLLPLVIKHGSMSIERIHLAIITTLEQHTVLRTAINFDKKCGTLRQDVQSIVGTDNYSFQLTKQSIQSKDEIAALLKNESIHHFAELDRGLVVRCHLIKMGLDDDNEYLKPDDLIIFVFHRIAFDYNSIGPFITAFTQAYDQIKPNVTGLQYIDFTIYEDQYLVNVTEDSEIRRAQQFWSKMMNDYSLNEKYPLPMTSILGTKMRSGRGYSTTIALDSNLVEAQIKFASLHDISMFHLELACFFLLIYELNDGSISDLCVICPSDNRPLVDTKLMIGMFTNLLPYRIRLNASDNFMNLVKQISRLDTDILKYSQLPYQQIISGNKDLCSTKIPFYFHFDSVRSFSANDVTPILKTNDAALCLYTDHAWLYDNGIALNDFTIKMIHNESERTMHCIFECSADCYDEVTAFNIGQRFQNLLLHIFINNTETIEFNPTLEKIGNLFLLPITIQKLPGVSQQPPNVIKKSKLFEENCSVLFFYNLIWVETYT